MDTVGVALLRAVKERGAEGIFGIPGDYILPFFKQVQESELLPLYTLSHEPSLAYAADAAARYSGQLGVMAVTYGAGALNAVNGVAQANAERSPLVVIAGAPSNEERASGFLLHHQAESVDSQMAIYKHISCAQARLDDPSTAHLEIARVLDACKQYSRPVYIELPRHMSSALCHPVPGMGAEPIDETAVRQCARLLLDRILRAESPVMLAGIEVRRYGVEVEAAALARWLGMPVVTTFLGQGIFAGEDVPWAGTYLGRAGEAEVTALVEESDALLLLGIIFCDGNLGLSGGDVAWEAHCVIAHSQVEIDEKIYLNTPIKAVMKEMLALAQLESTVTPIKLPLHHSGPYMPDDTKLQPQDIAAAINHFMAESSTMPLLADVGDSLFVTLAIHLADLVAPAYYASMGFAIPGGMGIQAVSGKRPLILTGDGSFQMSGMELGNCRRYGWSPIVIVLNNQSWEMIRIFQPETAYSFLGDWGYAQLGESLGGVGIRIETRQELHAGLRQAAADPDHFYLLELMLPPGSSSPGLARFVDGIKQGKGIA